MWIALPLFSACLALPAQQLRLNADAAKLSGPNIHLVSPAPASAANSVPATPAGAAPAYISGFLSEGDHASFTFASPAAGLYTLGVAFRSAGRKGFSIEVNGLGIAGPIAATPNGDFVLQALATVELDKGPDTITIDRGWGFYDVAYLQLTPVKEVAHIAKPPAVAVDANITPEAAALLSRLDSAYGKTTLLGVYSQRDADYVAEQTGVLPGIMGGDLLPYSPQAVAHGSHPERADEVARMIAASKAGYIITMSWHWHSPAGIIDSREKPWWRGFYTDSTNFDLAKTLADPQSADYTAMMSDIDAIAVQLRKLQDAHVPILWRPLHEASGGWFWWGAKGPKPFIQLWHILYDRLVNVDGIHNLIWVYTSDSDAAWYPGDRYADIIGIDSYPKDLRDPQSQLWADLAQRYGDRKLLTISEFGGVPDVPRMQRMGEFWSYAVSWSGKEGPKKNTADELKRLYTSPGVTTMPIPANLVVTPSTTPPATADPK